MARNTEDRDTNKNSQSCKIIQFPMNKTGDSTKSGYGYIETIEIDGDTIPIPGSNDDELKRLRETEIRVWMLIEKMGGATDAVWEALDDSELAGAIVRSFIMEVALKKGPEAFDAYLSVDNSGK